MTQTLILPHIERLSPYPMGERPPEGIRTVKLNQNESPYPPSPLVLKALRSIGEEELSRYPDAVNGGLRAVLAERFGVNAERIFCGNGSSEIISLIMKVFVGAQRRVALPDPTFALYATAAAVHRAECIAVPTDSDYAISIDGLLNSGADAVVLVNPNAPTGRTLPPAEVERLVSRFPGLVIIDEAYIDFAPEGTSALPLLGRYENVLLLRTFSKCYALAGARVGYCFGAEPLIAALEKSKDSFNVNAVSARLAAAALQDREYAERTAAAICRTRDSFAAGLERSVSASCRRTPISCWPSRRPGRAHRPPGSCTASCSNAAFTSGISIIPGLPTSCAFRSGRTRRWPSVWRLCGN